MGTPEYPEVSLRQLEYVKSLEDALLAARDRIRQLEAAWARGTPLSPLRDVKGFWHPELERRVAEAIQEYPDMEAEWWLGPSAALGVVERWLEEDR